MEKKLKLSNPILLPKEPKPNAHIPLRQVKAPVLSIPK
jgi:hypothetical protein